MYIGRRYISKVWGVIPLFIAVILVAVNVNFASADSSSGNYNSYTNVLVNSGFEQSTDYGSTDPGPGWSSIQTQYSYGTGYLTLNPFPFGHSGNMSASVISGEGQNNTGSIIQTVTLPGGTYDFKLSGWTWQYESDTQDNAAWVRADLYNEPSDHIVSDPGWFGAVSSATPGGQASTWVHLTNTFDNIQVQNSVSLIITQRANGYGNTGHGSALSDDWTLKVKKVK